jgi:hypothetical protein
MAAHGFFRAILLVILMTAPVSAETFRSDSKRLKNTTMDIVITETERSERTSVVHIQIKAIGSSVGSSFFLLCSVRDLAQQRGHYRYIAKAEGQPHPNHMLIEQFAPICDKMQ